MQIMTVSEERCFRLCPRKHRLRYALGVRPAVESKALYFGKLIHNALELYMTKRDLGLTIDCVRGCDADPFDKAKAEAMMLGYDARWHDDGVTVIAVEAEFVAPMVNPYSGKPSRTFQLGGKLDALIDVATKPMLCEHKTTSESIEPGSDYRQRLALDAQISIYYHGARALGYEPTGCLYDMLRKPQLKPFEPGKKRAVAETPDEYRVRCIEAIMADPLRYYQRQEVTRSEGEELEAAADAWQTARMIRDADLMAQRGINPPRNPDACKQWNRTCEYFPICTGIAAADDPVLYRVAERKHEELAEVA